MIYGDHLQVMSGGALVWLAANARYMTRSKHACGQHRMRRLIRLMHYQQPNTSNKHPQHKIWPYLLGNVVIEWQNQVCRAEIIYIPMQQGFLQLIVIMGWNSHEVLAWRLLNSMDADFYIEALKEALAKYGSPKVFKTD